MSTLSKIIVKEDSINTAVAVHATIPEFDKPADTSYFENRYKGKQHVIFVAYLNDKPIGYMIAYDRFGSDSIYCWMAGVNPQFRKMGALSKLMNKLEDWCKENSVKTIHIKTRNRRREMLNFLVRNGFFLTEVQPEPNIVDNRILLQKPVDNK